MTLLGAGGVAAVCLLFVVGSPVTVLLTVAILFALVAVRCSRATGRPGRSASSEAALGNLVEAHRSGGRLTAPVAAIVIELRGTAANTLVDGPERWASTIGIIARRMAAADLGPEFALARIGPHAFGAILRSPDSADALRAAEHLVALCRNPVPTAHGEVRIDAVAGVRHAAVGERCTGEELIRTADAALRLDGRTQSPVTVVDHRLVRHAECVLAVEAEVRESLDTNLLTSRLVPVVDVHNDEIVGLRAAYDWTASSSTDPQLLGAVADSLGLRRAVETQALMRTISTAAESSDNGVRHRVVAPLDASRLADPRAVGQIRLLLEACGFDDRQLVLEFGSEDAGVLEPTRLYELKELGIGVGFSLRQPSAWTDPAPALPAGYDSLSVRARDVLDQEGGEVVDTRADRLHRMTGGDLRRVTVCGVHDAEAALELSAAGLSVQCGDVHGRAMSAAELADWVARRARM